MTQTPGGVPPLFAAHIARLHKAASLQEVDRVPVVLAADAFHARQMGVQISDYLGDMTEAARINVASMARLGEIDSAEYLIPAPRAMGAKFLTNIKLPGRELGPDELWQVDEVGFMTPEDYDTILEKGFMAFAKGFLATRLPKTLADLMAFLGTDFGAVAGMHIVAGIVPFCGPICIPPVEVLSAARGMANFSRDLFRMPEKIAAVLEVMAAEEAEALHQQIRAMPQKPFSVFIAGARGAGEFLSPRFWNRFVRPHLQSIVEAVVAEGTYAYLHFDSNWDRDLEAFKALPKGKCILGLDHGTDIFKAKEILGDHLCLMGDVPAAMLTLGTPDQVHAYCTWLIREIGPKGFMLAAACCIPPDAKLENVKAMVSAATGA